MAKEKKEVKFLSRGLFETRLMSSKIHTHEMSLLEKIMGFLVGPFGTAALMAAVTQLRELYYTEVFYIDKIFGSGTYLIMCWVTVIFGVIFGILFGYVVEHNVSKEGKIRPLIFIGSLIAAISAFFLFFVPEFGSNVARLVWVYVFNILYQAVGVTLINLKINLITLSTRNQNNRNQVNLITKVSEFMLVGTGVTMVVGSILYYSILHNYPAQNWYLIVGVFSVLAFALSFVHYFFTKERITEEQVEEVINVPWYKQIGHMFTSKYWVMGFLLLFVMAVAGNLAGYNLNTNYCTVILGATAENQYNLIYTIAGGIPLGIGILIIYPLCKKFTIRWTTIVFSAIVVLSSALGFVFGKTIVGATILCFLGNIGTLPCIYIIHSLIYSANEEVEYKHGYRIEGTIGLAIATSASSLLSGVFSGVYEHGLSSNGYDAALDTAQPAGVINWLMFIKYGVPIIQYVLIIGILIFMDLEKKLPKMQEEIQLRRKAACEARGEVYYTPEEKAKLEEEENARLAEESRILDLKEKCKKKGLDFETENQKYLDKQAEKRAKIAAKNAAKNTKSDN
jgi:GPH family glycoside/pentoside/hexuronide:cation symporter